jgi:hypothetical protein
MKEYISSGSREELSAKLAKVDKFILNTKVFFSELSDVYSGDKNLFTQEIDRLSFVFDDFKRNKKDSNLLDLSYVLLKKLYFHSLSKMNQIDKSKTESIAEEFAERISACDCQIDLKNQAIVDPVMRRAIKANAKEADIEKQKLQAAIVERESKLVADKKLVKAFFADNAGNEFAKILEKERKVRFDIPQPPASDLSAAAAVPLAQRERLLN